MGKDAAWSAFLQHTSVALGSASSFHLAVCTAPILKG